MSARFLSWNSRARAEPDGLALHHDLRANLALRLKQHRVQVHRHRAARRAGLERLRPADLAAILGDGRVIRHVLRLERRDAVAGIGEVAA